MGEIVDAFRIAYDGCGPHCGHHKDIIELHNLRAAVNAYINAEIALTSYCVLGNHRRDPETAGDLQADVDTAYITLRQAVGR